MSGISEYLQKQVSEKNGKKEYTNVFIVCRYILSLTCALNKIIRVLCTDVFDPSHICLHGDSLWTAH